MPLVIDSLGSGHTQTHKRTHTDDPHRINFKKPGTPACSWLSPGLIRVDNMYAKFNIPYCLELQPGCLFLSN